jgi:hypothetical protein
MPRRRLLALVLSTLCLGVACDGRSDGLPRVAPMTSVTPTAPSPSVSRGQIVLRLMDPDSGARVPVRECTYGEAFFSEECAAADMSFEVVYDSDVEHAVLTATFYRGGQRCGMATSNTVRLRAGVSTFFDARTISLSTEDVRLLCPLPIETDRVVAQLWERSRPAASLLQQEFAHTYAFVADTR